MSGPADTRFARQALIPGWDQARLAAATVLVAGAGALGNEVLKNLALLGVGALVVVDLDRVERSNLSRTLLFEESDVGAPKATAAARPLARLSPALRVTAIEGDLRFALGLGRLRACALALGCLDSQGARAYLSRMCQLAGTPLLDGAMWALGGEVRSFLTAEGPCFSCTLTPAERSELWLRYSCSGGFQLAGAEPPAPTTITTTAVVGGLLAQEAARFLLGQPLENGTALVYNGQAGRLHRASLGRDPSCPAHTPLDWSRVEVLDAGPEALTAGAILERAGRQLGAAPTLDLGRDLLVELACPACGRVEPVGRPQGLVPGEAARCPACGAEREALVTSTVSPGDPWEGWSLGRLGVVAGDVLSARAGDQILLSMVPLGH